MQLQEDIQKEQDKEWLREAYEKMKKEMYGI